MIKRFKWEKYVDPLQKEMKRQDDLEENPFDDDEEGSCGHKNGKLLSTPFGLLSVPLNGFLTEHFDFWVLHTNFIITVATLGSIQRTPGVETVEPITRYRMRIGFPKSGFFDSNKIIESIEKAILSHDRGRQNNALIGMSSHLATKIIETRNLLDIQYENWSILAFPNGNFDILTSRQIEDEEFGSKLALHHKISRILGCRLLTSNM